MSKFGWNAHRFAKLEYALPIEKPKAVVRGKPRSRIRAWRAEPEAAEKVFSEHAVFTPSRRRSAAKPLTSETKR